MDRRQFIEKSIIAGAGLSLTPVIGCSNNKDSETNLIPKRQLGSTGEMLSIIGFGGIIVDKMEQDAANEQVAKACNSGINYFDVAPTYGIAEDRLGPALKPYRKNCFLACKTTERKGVGAEKELHSSLKKLETDHFDLYQLHGISKREDVETAFGPGGAMEVFIKAKKEGKVRFLGFSAHSEEAALLAMEKYNFDTALFPLNYVCWYQGNFGPGIVAKTIEKKMGILALKALAHTVVPKGEKAPYEKLWYKPVEDKKLAGLALKFTFSHGTTAAIPPGDARFFWKAVELAKNINELTAEENDYLCQMAEGVQPLFST